MAASTEDTRYYENSASLIRVHGILSIIFGSLGIFFGLFFLLLTGFGISDYNSYQVISSFIFGLLVFIFWVLPHIYLLISGIHLIKNPRPSITKTLVIVNLIVGVFYNLVLLVFAIINLTQIADYERGYPVKK